MIDTVKALVKCVSWLLKSRRRTARWGLAAGKKAISCYVSFSRGSCSSMFLLFSPREVGFFNARCQFMIIEFLVIGVVLVKIMARNRQKLSKSIGVHVFPVKIPSPQHGCRDMSR